MGRTTVVDVKLGTEGRQLDRRLLGAHSVGPLGQLVSEPVTLVPGPLGGLSHTTVPVARSVVRSLVPEPPDRFSSRAPAPARRVGQVFFL